MKYGVLISNTIAYSEQRFLLSIAMVKESFLLVKEPASGSAGKGGSFSLVQEPASGLYTYKSDKFSARNEDRHFSKVFIVEGRKW
jgi:hypothetical protein